MIRCFAAGVVLWASVANAQDLTCRVIGITDGDTLRCLTENNEQIRVRLAEIDAPEKRQPFGAKSKQSLSDLCFQHQAELRIVDRDRYGRTVARVTCAGIDANAEQVRRGMAWVFDRYATDQNLYTIQAEAMAAKRGVWNDPAPIPPWEWRRGNTAGTGAPAIAVDQRVVKQTAGGQIRELSREQPAAPLR